MLPITLSWCHAYMMSCNSCQGPTFQCIMNINFFLFFSIFNISIETIMNYMSFIVEFQAYSDSELGTFPSPVLTSIKIPSMHSILPSLTLWLKTNKKYQKSIKYQKSLETSTTNPISHNLRLILKRDAKLIKLTYTQVFRMKTLRKSFYVARVDWL